MNNRIIYHPLTATPLKRNIAYTELTPCKELHSYIRCYWGTENPLVQIENNDSPKLVIPDTCVDIIYHIDYTDNVVTGGFCGINDYSFLANSSGTIGHTVSTFAIRFYAWSAYAFADDSLQSTMNGYFDVGARFEWLDRIIRPQLLERKTLQEKASFIERLLLKRLSNVKENAVVNGTIHNILTNKGSMDVSKLARFTGILRNLYQVFIENLICIPSHLQSKFCMARVC